MRMNRNGRGHRRGSQLYRAWLSIAVAVAAGIAALLLHHAPAPASFDARGRPTAAAAGGYFDHLAFIASAFANSGNGKGNGGGNGNGNGNGGGNGNGNGGGNGNGNANGNGNGGLGKAKGKTKSESSDDDDSASVTPATGATTGAAVTTTGGTVAGHDVAANEVLAIDTDEAALSQLRQMGFAIIERRELPTLGISVLRLRTPHNVDSIGGLALMRGVLPTVTADVNALYQPYRGQGSQSAQVELASLPANDYALRMVGWPRSDGCGAGQKIGLIDTSIAIHAPVLPAYKVHQRGFVEEGQADSDMHHGTAIASLLVGQTGDSGDPQWHGLLPSAELYAAAVFQQQDGRSLASAMVIAEALDWLAQEHVPVVNISLSGEPNLVMEYAIRRSIERHAILVAAAGNFGPSAPPSYPAAYPGVIAVTAVDQDSMVFASANQGSYITFAAPGVRIWVPGEGTFGRYVSGTSFAVPFVAAAAVLAVGQNPSASPDAVDAELAAHSEHLGPPGRNPIYGFGLIKAASTCQAGDPSPL